jgi:hypothetical protein
MQAILTDAPLQPNALLSEPICDHPPDLSSFCPIGAIDTSRELTVEIAGKKMQSASVDFRRCRICRNGALKNRYHESGDPDRIAAVCGRTYLDHLQREGRLSRQFRGAFRKREPWTVTVNYQAFDEG